MMKFLVTILSLFILNACSPEGCNSPGPGKTIKINITNSSNQSIVIDIQGSSIPIDDFTLAPSQSKLTQQTIYWSAVCNSNIPLDLQYAATLMIFLENANNNNQPKQLIFGDSYATYQKYLSWWQVNATDYEQTLANAHLHSHSVYFIPNAQARQDLGLLVANPTGTELFTSLDPWRPYVSGGFTLNVDVRDLQTGDIGLTFSGVPAN